MLTDKEVKEYTEKMKQVFVTVFRWMDYGITQTNKAKAVAVIWSDIDDADILILVEETVAAAKRSRIIATGVRQLSRAHRLLRLGIITGPRFMQTVKHYSNNGGFILPWMDAVQIEEENRQ